MTEKLRAVTTYVTPTRLKRYNRFTLLRSGDRQKSCPTSRQLPQHTQVQRSSFQIHGLLYGLLEHFKERLKQIRPSLHTAIFRWATGAKVSGSHGVRSQANQNAARQAFSYEPNVSEGTSLLSNSTELIMADPFISTTRMKRWPGH